MSELNSATGEMEKFQAAVRKLSSDINRVGVDWHDDKHAKLASLIQNIASQTKSVMGTFSQFESSVKEFDNACNG